MMVYQRRLPKVALAALLAVCLFAPYTAVAQESSPANSSGELDMNLQDVIDSAAENETIEGSSGSTSDMRLEALIVPNDQVIHVQVPTSVSVAVDIDVNNLTYKGYRSADSTVRNLPTSMLPIRVDVVEVHDKAPQPGGKGILEFVDMTLVERVHSGGGVDYIDGDTKVVIPPKPGESTILKLIYPDFEGKFATNIAVKEEQRNAEIPVGNYTTDITMKVRALITP